MRQTGLGAYGKRVSRAARTLLENQGFDGGWGLTLTSVSSIVNTTEALAVLRAAGIAGKPVRDALSFLADSAEDHCRPRQKGGRGENTRFVCFALSGLVSYPQFFAQPGIADACAWCVDWLGAHQLDQGWPEVAGVDDVSLHQTARAVLALSGLRKVLSDLGPGFVIHSGTNTSVLLDRVEPLIAHGVRGLLYHRRNSGAWGWRTYVDTAPSPSKTALCLMAVAGSAGSLRAGDPFASSRDVLLESGGVSGDVVMRRPSQVVAEAADWLLRNHQRWENFVEDDKDVQGTAWEHMAYALGVQSVLRAGGNPHDQRLAPAWRLMDGLWDGETGLWNEPGASGERATIRAAFHAVCAYEEARARVAQIGMAEGMTASQVQDADPGTAHLQPQSMELLAVRHELKVSTRDAVATFPLPERLFEAAALLHQAPDGLAVSEIAAALHVSPSSVAKYVQRLNQAASGAFGGAGVRLVVPWPPGRGSGYALAVSAGGTGTGGEG
jgi:hypothetical protein